MTKPKLLVVDDGDRYIELAHALLQDYDYATRCELDGPCWECPHQPGCTLTHAHDWGETRDALAKSKDVDVVLLDVVFDVPEERLLAGSGTVEERRRRQGLAILAQLRRDHHDVPVVLMTSRDELSLDANDESLLADEYVTLAGADAFDARALSLLIERVLARSRSDASSGYVFGTDKTMRALERRARTLAVTSLPILLLGEPGTGKSAMAERVIHEASERSGPFVAVDLSAIPKELVASELFGSTRGAFSGAVDRAGRFERANGGTLFLDEIGNLSQEAQRMLLLTIQDRRITRLGESTSRPIDVKLVAATNADLPREVRAGRFRPDLYARLNPAARLTLPPLRKRMRDLPELAETLTTKIFAGVADRELLARYQERVGLRGPVRASLSLGKRSPKDATQEGVTFVFSSASAKVIRAHSFPGNVRELELMLANALLFALSDALSLAESGRAGGDVALIPVPNKLVRELIEASWIPSAKPSAPSAVEPREHLRDVSRGLERDLFVKLFFECDGDFERMAKRLLLGDDAANAKRVRLRFNQLGLSARDLKK